MTTEFPKYPKELMPHNIKANPYLDHWTKELLDALVIQFMTVSKAAKTKWIYPQKDMDKYDHPELKLKTQYLREYNLLFTRTIEESIKKTASILSNHTLCPGGSDVVDPERIPAIKKLTGILVDLKRRSGAAVWKMLNENYEAACKRR